MKTIQSCHFEQSEKSYVIENTCIKRFLPLVEMIKRGVFVQALTTQFRTLNFYQSQGGKGAKFNF